MSATDDMLLCFWGKTPKAATDPPDQFHPALHHMLDVAFVAEALVHEQAPRRFRDALAHAWKGVPCDQLFAWLPFLIATHDLGKISAAFQGQVSKQRTRLEQQHAITFPRRYEHAPYHAEVSAVWLHNNLLRREPGTAKRLLWVVRDAMGGHHGRFTQQGIGNIAQRLQRSERNDPAWDAHRAAAYTLLRSLLAPDGELAALGAPQHLRPATAALTGFIILCDWMGSNNDAFPAAPHITLDAYMHEGRARAARAVHQAGLLANRPQPTYTTFTACFQGAIPTPRPLQEAIDAIPAAVLEGPFLAVIEAPTGEGKTEAALALAQRRGATGQGDELFFGLPTMATSNQMFRRLTQFFEARYKAEVKLTHSQAAVLEDELRRAALANDQDSADPQAASARSAVAWFAGSKKAMLAPFGVGTVDQIEMAGLNVRHYMLRLFALAGKTVIIDEVHAYDAYMSVILEHTLTWLASLGTSVILLSATLPATRHHHLAARYLQGLGQPAPNIPAQLPYPAISLYHADAQAGEPYRATPPVFRPDQRFTLRLAPRLDAVADAHYLLDLVRKGGAVARICNRVDDAQRIYAALKDLLPANQHVLLHARFPMNVRQQREQRIATLVGKETARTPDQPLIIVGTQVLEQSLDYDVDVMVSDFAPIDLLLQRAGRLHRHINERAGKRPPRHASPVLEVLLPLDEAELPNWKPWKRIYDAFILWRTWEVLREKMQANEREIVLPRDYRLLIEAVYQEQPHVSPETPYSDAMAKTLKQLELTRGEMETHARYQLTPPAGDTDAITEVADRQFTEDEDGTLAGWQVAKTRLGDSITVLPLYRVAGDLCLDSNGTHRLSTDIPPRTANELKEVLERSIPISDRRIIAAFRAGELADMRWPWPERQVPRLLRSLFPLMLDQQHTATITGRTVRLDADLGLVTE